MKNALLLHTENPEVRLQELATASDDIAYVNEVRASVDHLSVFEGDTVWKYLSPADAAKSRAEAGDRLRLGIWSRDNVFLGTVNARPQGGDGIEIGYWIGAEHTGNGYATIATRAITRHLMSRRPEERIFASVKPRNHASIRVLKHAGFDYSGWDSDHYEEPHIVYDLNASVGREKAPRAFTVRSARSGDAEQLRTTLEHWIRRTGETAPIAEEVTGVMQAMEDSTAGKNDKTYLVAEGDGGRPVGVMGMVGTGPEDAMWPYAETKRPVELINAYMDPHVRKSGAGAFLAKLLEDLALQRGFTEIVVNSGPRYEESGWPFWAALYGEHKDVIRDHYGVGVDARVWTKLLDSAWSPKP